MGTAFDPKGPLSRSSYYKAKSIDGCIAGLIGVTCTFPVDLCKTRLQNTETLPSGEKVYKGLLDCFVKTYRHEGFRGLYSGYPPNILLITPEKIIKLVMNDIFRDLLGVKAGEPSVRAMVAGGLAGGCQIIVTTPMEYLKIQGQDAGRVAQVKEKFSLKNIPKYYKGFCATALRDVTFSAIYFPLVAIFNTQLLNRLDSKGNRWYVSFASAIPAAIVATFAVNPFDVVKTRLQTVHKGQGEKTYTGVVDCFSKIWKTEGIRAFYKGGSSRVIAISLLFGIAQTVYWIGIGQHALVYVFGEDSSKAS